MSSFESVQVGVLIRPRVPVEMNKVVPMLAPEVRMELQDNPR
jgi:hypothetical protein